MKISNRRIVTVTNLAIAVVALLLCIVSVKKFLLADGNPMLSPSVNLGTRISISDVNWKDSRETLLVVLQEGCRFCSESAPFYKRLVAKASENGSIRLIAVLPQSPSEAHRYLDTLGVSIANVKQSNLSGINVPGTPTLLLLDDQGIVRASWVGRLSAEKEIEVLDIVRNVGLD
jgi:hypothetical protein